MALEFPFTAAQWKELERQAMIYKYMVASVPVPYQLLLPIIQNLPPVSHSPLMRQLSKQDLEPGRCKRTDGKKWRCSRDVAPNQKYCERHMHRGRPRSRKHVELSKNPSSSSSASSSSNNTRLPSSNQPCKVLGSTILPSATTQPCFFLDNNIQSNKRGSDWSTEQQWLQIMHTSRSIFNNDCGESFTDFGNYLGPTSDNKVIKDSSSTGNLDLSMSMGLGLGVSPLAEVLQPPNPNPPTSPVSSPSGVLQRTMLSFSDTNTNSPPPTDTVAFQWFS